MVKKRILVVDDERELVKAIKIRLEQAGYEVLVAYDGQEALHRARKEKPELIILDLVLPKMDGFQTHKALKADGITRNIPIIAYTTQNPEVVAKKGIEALDIVDFVLKPFDTQALVFAVERALSNQGKQND